MHGLPLPIIHRRSTQQVHIGGVTIGSDHPVVVQSMTNTNTADITSTVEQIQQLVAAGSQMVRLTVNDDAAAHAVPYVKRALQDLGINVPLIGCFHYNGHTLLQKHHECAQALSKYRINPGNVGFGKKRDTNFDSMINCAIANDKVVRIGVNWGSLDQDILAATMDKNARSSSPIDSGSVMRWALVVSAIESAERARNLGLTSDKIVLSAKVSRVQDLISVYRELSRRCDYPLHLGLTEAGPDSRGIVASTAGLAVLLQEGIGDTIRVSITPGMNSSRTQEVQICQEILQSIGLANFTPSVAACPGCGRTSSTYFQKLASDIQDFIKDNISNWRPLYPGVEGMNVAVMGCIVNGPGESKHADIGISLPGTGENPVAPVFIDGKKCYTLRGDNIAAEFKILLLEYIKSRYA